MRSTKSFGLLPRENPLLRSRIILLLMKTIPKKRQSVKHSILKMYFGQMDCPMIMDCLGWNGPLTLFPEKVNHAAEIG